MDKALDTSLREEFVNLFQYVQRLREEIAQMTGHCYADSAFENITVQLGAIVAGTENATNSILKAVESINTTTQKIQQGVDPAEKDAICESLAEQATEIMEACTFQDITGQRITKIVRSMQFVEDRIDAMVALWGRDEIRNLIEEREKVQPEGEGALLDGPQLPGDAITQEEIDALFD